MPTEHFKSQEMEELLRIVDEEIRSNDPDYDPPAAFNRGSELHRRIKAVLKVKDA